VNPVAEMAWAGYLAFLHQEGALPDDPDAVWAMKADFLSGFEDE
jgi:hypothetical protein